MFLNRTDIKRLRISFILFFLFANGFTIYSQSETLKIYIEEKLQLIENDLETKQYDLALSKIEELENYSDYLKDDRNRLNLSYIKAKALYGNQEQELAINLLLQGLDKLENMTALISLKIEYAMYLGKVLESANNFSKARSYYRIGLVNAESRLDTVNILNSYINVASTYYEENNLDSAINYYDKVLAFPLSKKTRESISRAYNNLSIIAINNDNFEFAKEYSNKYYDLKKYQNDTIGMVRALSNLSGILYKNQEYQKAKENYLRAFETINKIRGDEKAIEVKETLLYNLAYVNEELGNYKEAYLYLIQASELTDSLVKASGAKNISEIEAKYNVAKKAQEVEEAESDAFRAQVFFYGLALAFLAFIVFGYIFYRN
ncbi:MAG: tetratricopeptide repeat protein [Flavobacteriaceae bacterium]|nr:tetratricopeptide repeat protein [Flavobacteriaceae bacterium]